MTPEKRAEKILTIVRGHSEHLLGDAVIKPQIAAEILAAENVARAEAYKQALANYKADGLEIAYKQGLEDAARIADLHVTNHPKDLFREGFYNAIHQVAANVRAKAKELSGTSGDVKGEPVK